jgi:transposase
MGGRRELWIGVDVSKEVIDVAVGEAAVVRIARTVERVAEWATGVPRHARVVLEATAAMSSWSRRRYVPAASP